MRTKSNPAAKRLWFKDCRLDDIAGLAEQENILNRLGLRFTELGPDYIKASLPVDGRTHQPYGILHGGATCVLAETLGSVASLLVVDMDKNFAVGSVITTNHLRPVEGGVIEGVCRPVHIGRTKHVWQIEIFNEAGKMVAKSELTCAVTDKRG